MLQTFTEKQFSIFNLYQVYVELIFVSSNRWINNNFPPCRFMPQIYSTKKQWIYFYSSVKSKKKSISRDIHTHTHEQPIVPSNSKSNEVRYKFGVDSLLKKIKIFYLIDFFFLGIKIEYWTKRRSSTRKSSSLRKSLKTSNDIRLIW